MTRVQLGFEPTHRVRCQRLARGGKRRKDTRRTEVESERIGLPAERIDREQRIWLLRPEILRHEVG